MRLTDFDTLTFDCYGTLVDWETGIFDGLRPLLAKVNRDLTRDDVLEVHALHESFQQKYTPAKRYQELLPVVYKRLAEEWQVPLTLEEYVIYGKSVKNWPASPDSAEVLKYLKQDYKLVILSNIDDERFNFSHAKLAVEFDAIITAEDVGAYKPSARNFEYMLRSWSALACRGARFCIRPRVCFTITNRRIHSASNRVGSIVATLRMASVRR